MFATWASTGSKTDAGNTSCDVARQVVEQCLDYFAQIKSPHGEIHAEAKAVLRKRRPSRAHASYTDTQNGQVVSYHLWRYDLSDCGWLDWHHARPSPRHGASDSCASSASATPLRARGRQPASAQADE